MKMRNMMFGLIMASLGLAVNSYAISPDTYLPPERILCKLTSMDKLSCLEFDRSYLTEVTDFTSQDVGRETYEVFHFVSAIAYYTPNQTEANVFITYKNSQAVPVRLTTVSTALHPDLSYGGWKKYNDEIYKCNAGYQRCPLTGLSV